MTSVAFFHTSTGAVSSARAEYGLAAPLGTDAPKETSLKQKFLDTLPPQVSDGLDFNVWTWLGYYRTDEPDKHNLYDGEISLDITKTFDKRVAITAEGNFIDANGERRAELEQGFVSTLLSQSTGSILTVGKFNANFGIEPRDFWNRVTGTTSLLFGAQPQDLVGVMFTQPLGETGITLRPFISADFQGQFYFDQPPGGGLVAEYWTPGREWHFELTNWVGPGMALYGGQPLRQPYPKGGYGESGGIGDLLGNWQGPNLTAERLGTLYFVDANITWRPRKDFSIAAEYLMGTTGTSTGRWGWAGAQLLATFDITDKWRVYGGTSYLDDNNWLITGAFQRIWEVSGGVSYFIFDKLELRSELRHDHSTVFGDSNVFSLHLTAGF